MPEKASGRYAAPVLRAGNLQHRWGERTLVIGIINVTPDSFSGDGVAATTDPVASALDQAQRFASAGADLLDVGGESTRPGATPLSSTAERNRIVPVIGALRSALDLPISVDTWKAEVAAAALDAGASLVNDIWGLRLPDGGWNRALAALVAARNVPIVLMHNRRATATRSAAGAVFGGVAYDDLVADVLRELGESIRFAREQGISADRIIVDPGIGFGKTPDHNIVLMRELHRLTELGYPVLLGTSRKSFIGLALGGVPPQARVTGTIATTAIGIVAGVDIVRVHDVAATVQAVHVADAITRPGVWERLRAETP